MTPRRQYVASLTGMRGVAAVFVFLFHYHYFNPGIRMDLTVPFIGRILQFPLALGWIGVDLFFVLSGFLLTLPFANARLNELPAPRLGRYFKRRVLRVFPAYYTQLAIILAAGAWFLSWRELSGPSLLAHLVMFFHIGPRPVEPLVGIWWTLPVEFSFYLLLPLIAWFLTLRRWPIFIVAAAVFSIAYRWWAAQAHPGPSAWFHVSQLPGMLPEFLCGSSAALLLHHLQKSRRTTPRALHLDVLFASGLAAAGLWCWNVVLKADDYWQGHWAMLLAPVVFGLCLSVSVWAAYRGSRLGRLLLANRFIYFLGLISYSLYLWHYVVLQQLPLVFGGFLASLSGLPRFVLTFATVLAVATASYYLVERPFYRLPKRPTRAPEIRTAAG